MRRLSIPAVIDLKAYLYVRLAWKVVNGRTGYEDCGGPMVAGGGDRETLGCFG